MKPSIVDRTLLVSKLVAEPDDARPGDLGMCIPGLLRYPPRSLTNDFERSLYCVTSSDILEQLIESNSRGNLNRLFRSIEHVPKMCGIPFKRFHRAVP